MTNDKLVQTVFDATPSESPKGLRSTAFVLIALGLLGLGLGFAAGESATTGWSALLTGTVLVIGVALVGPLLSAVFQLTGAKWGRAYRRLAESSVVLMIPGLLGVGLLLAGGNAYLPWVHEHPHVGGKAVWLTRGFWDARVVGALVISYALGLRFVWWSVRRDFCVAGVKERFTGKLGDLFGSGIANPDREAERCERKLSVLAPLVVIVYAFAFTLLGIDLIMALEPDWFSTLFGAWYFMGNAFFGLALVAIFSVALSNSLGLTQFFSTKRQGDMATLLLAFCLINVDFFWNQYLTIWYANLPEETGYLIERTVNRDLPWRSLSFVSLAAFFLIPFTALLLRRVKQNAGLLRIVALIAMVGIFLARFIEIAPPLLQVAPGSGADSLIVPVISAGLTLAGLLGLGLLLYSRVIAGVPIMALGDSIFTAQFAETETNR